MGDNSGEGSSEETNITDRVRELEAMFADRYTEKDEEYMKTVSAPKPKPPCVKNWFVRQRGNWNRGGYRGGGDRRQDDRRRDNYRDNYRDNRDSYHGNQRQYHGHHSNSYQQRHDNYGYHGNQGRHDRRYQPY